MGGSVAWGHGAKEVGVTDFAALFFTHIRVRLQHNLSSLLKPTCVPQSLHRRGGATPVGCFSCLSSVPAGLHEATETVVHLCLPLFLRESGFAALSQDTYPHPEHVLQNGAVPGTHSGYMSLCVKWHVPEDADLVLVRAAECVRAAVEMLVPCHRWSPAQQMVPGITCACAS